MAQDDRRNQLLAQLVKGLEQFLRGSLALFFRKGDIKALATELKILGRDGKFSVDLTIPFHINDQGVFVFDGTKSNSRTQVRDTSPAPQKLLTPSKPKFGQNALEDSFLRELERGGLKMGPDEIADMERAIAEVRGDEYITPEAVSQPAEEVVSSRNRIERMSEEMQEDHRNLQAIKDSILVHALGLRFFQRHLMAHLINTSDNFSELALEFSEEDCAYMIDDDFFRDKLEEMIDLIMRHDYNREYLQSLESFIIGIESDKTFMPKG